MKTFITIVYLFSFLIGTCQKSKTIYLFPGQGADKRQFDSLIFDTSFKIKIIEYGTPSDSETMASFARNLSPQIDTTEEFILIGVSLGGMICVELSEILNPDKTIIISSAKNKYDLPGRYSFQKKIPIYRCFSGNAILAGAKFLQPIVERDSKKNRATFKAMLAAKEPKYMKRTVGLIVAWEREFNSKQIIQIHGTDDNTLTFRSIQSPDYIIENGSHMMTITRAAEISIVLNEILTN